jgi:hypothetical protein
MSENVRYFVAMTLFYTLLYCFLDRRYGNLILMAYFCLLFVHSIKSVDSRWKLIFKNASEFISSINILLMIMTAVTDIKVAVQQASHSGGEV